MESEMEWVQKAAEEIVAGIDTEPEEMTDVSAALWVAAIIQRHAPSTETETLVPRPWWMSKAFSRSAIDQAMDALESDATLEQRRAAWDRLRDVFYPAVPAPPSRETETPRCFCRMPATMTSTGITHTPEACYFNPQGLPVPAPPSRPAEPDMERPAHCVCGQPWQLGIVHRGDGPCYFARYQGPPEDPSRPASQPDGYSSCDEFERPPLPPAKPEREEPKG